jgi:hypothetical protein
VIVQLLQIAEGRGDLGAWALSNTSYRPVLQPPLQLLKDLRAAAGHRFQLFPGTFLLARTV